MQVHAEDEGACARMIRTCTEHNIFSQAKRAGKLARFQRVRGVRVPHVGEAASDGRWQVRCCQELKILEQHVAAHDEVVINRTSTALVIPRACKIDTVKESVTYDAPSGMN